jgi:L-malate glycosyltransferase
MGLPICVVTNAYPDHESSYHGIFIRRIVLDMAERGWESHVLAPRIYRDSLPFERHPGHTVRRFSFLSAQKLLIEYEKPPYLRLSTLLASGVWFTVRTVLGRGCRLVHAHWAFPAGLIGLAAARLTGRPLVLHVHGSDCRLAESRGGAAAALFALAARGADTVVSVSEPISAYLRRIGVKEDSLLTCPLGVDERMFHTRVTPDPEAAGEFTVISTRSLLPLYRVGDLLEAASSARQAVPGLRLVVAGEGAEAAGLREACRELSLAERTVFTGRVSPEKLAGLLAASAVYVSASPSEGTSVSLLEALAVGCLPVVTDIPSNRAWVSHGGNGLLFAPGNADELCACLVRAAGDTALRARAREAGPRLVRERGLWSTQIDLLDKACRRLLA